jgi:hypothetical protein
VAEIDELLAEADRLARLQDVLVDSFVRELDQTLVLLNRRIRVLIRQFDAENGRMVGRAVNLGLAIRARQAVMDALVEAGVIEALERSVDEALDRVAQRVLSSSRVASRAAGFPTAFTFDALVALKELRLATLLDLADDTAAGIWRLVMEGVLSARTSDDLIEDVADLLDSSLAEARTVYDTAVSTYQRQVEALLSEGEADEVFLYAGPVDLKIRPFCKERVGKVYTRSEIDGWDNGQLPNPFLTAGGYNCRHQLMRLSRFSELRELAGKDERVPEIARQLKGVRTDRKAA